MWIADVPKTAQQKLDLLIDGLGRSGCETAIYFDVPVSPGLLQRLKLFSVHCRH
jgi:hypothetical protein